MSETVTDLQALPTLSGENGGGGFSCTNITVVCCQQTICVGTNL